MVLTYAQEHVYRHPWDRVTAAAWRKFTDPGPRAVLPHILDVHTLSRRLDPSDPSRIAAVRSITIRSPELPFLLRRVIGKPAVVVHCIESTAVDARARRMEVVAVNASLKKFIEVEERSVYEPHPDRPDEWTVFRQETRITCSPFSAIAAIADRVEQKCAERFLQNSAKGREVVERICRSIESATSATASS